MARRVVSATRAETEVMPETTAPPHRHFDDVLRRKAYHLRPWAQHAIRLGTMGAVTLARLAFDPILGDRLPYSFYLIGLMVLAWYLRLGPVLVAAAASAVLAALLFSRPRGLAHIAE